MNGSTLFFGRLAPLSNFYQCKIRDSQSGHTFSCVEQYYTWYKAKCFEEDETALAVHKLRDPGAIQERGQHIKSFDKWTWAGVKIEVMESGNRLKYQQNRRLLTSLQTAEPRMAETNPHNPLWGLGINMEEATTLQPGEWPGINVMGRILTQIRKDEASGKFYEDKYIKHSLWNRFKEEREVRKDHFEPRIFRIRQLTSIPTTTTKSKKLTPPKKYPLKAGTPLPCTTT